MNDRKRVRFKLEELKELPYMRELNRSVIEMLEAQDELSYKVGVKAGVEKVVDWLIPRNIVIEYPTTDQNEETTISYDSLSSDPYWQAQLKIWREECQ